MTVTLPTAVSEQVFSRALDDFVAALGADAVLTSEDELAEFRDPFAYRTWDDYTSSVVLMPTTVEQIQAIVRIANERGVPLWTHAQGRNNGYGGPAPRVGGSVNVSLRNMNRVLEIDDECAYAVVEPGVRWFDLYDALRTGGHKLWLSIADVGWGSVIGNSLDNGVTYLPYGADFMAPCGMEVVLANGEVMRTGMGALPGSKSWHLYKRGLGPTLDPLFTQSNLGIVTKMGVWLLPQPECFMPLWLRVWKDDDLGPVMDILRRLRLDGTIEGVPQVLNTLALGSVFSSRAVVRRGRPAAGPGHRPDRARARDRPLDHALRALRRRGGRRPSLREDQGGVRRDSGRRGVGREVRSGPGRRARASGRARGGRRAEPRHQPHDGLVRRRGRRPHRFSPVAPLTGRDAIELRNLLRGLVENEAGLDYIVAMLPINARSFIHVTLVIFDTKNEVQARRAYDAAKLLVSEAGKRGYGEYRAHLDFMDLASEQYSFSGHAYRRFNEAIKDAVDPNGILSPGRHEIWPKALRPERNGSGAA